jgi:NADH-quinone oxidoreductase subunit D
VSPYSLYKDMEFDIPVGQGLKGELGDCYDRFYVRIQEMRQSLRIIRQAIKKIEPGPIMGKVSKVIKPPAGEVYVKTECPRGELGYHIVSNGEKNPYRVKVKSSCFTHVSMIPELSPGVMVADLVAIIGSIDIVLGEVDR